MIVKHKLQLDLIKRDVPQRIQTVQDDRYSRVLEIRLLADGMEYLPPENSTVLVRYQKPDGTGGAYDTLPDGSSAWSIDGGVLTVALAPQVCTAPGTAELAVSLLWETAEISTFTLLVDVMAAPGGKASSREYVNIQAFMPQPGNLTAGQYLMVKEVDAYGNATAIGCGAGGAASVEILGAERLDWSAAPYAKAAAGSTDWNRKYILGIPAGVPGYSPVRGLDYWTAEDQTVMRQESQAYLLEELAKKGTASPLFASDITGCTDESRLYVLPDGYVYSFAEGAWRNSGYVFMPQGEKGEKGEPGADGKDGYSVYYTTEAGMYDNDGGADEWYYNKSSVATSNEIRSGDFLIDSQCKLMKVRAVALHSLICDKLGDLKGADGTQGKDGAQGVGIKAITVAAVSMVSFTIDDVAYQAEEGMTWRQWCDSEYNTSGQESSEMKYYISEFGEVMNDYYLYVVDYGADETILADLPIMPKEYITFSP